MLSLFCPTFFFSLLYIQETTREEINDLIFNILYQLRMGKIIHSASLEGPRVKYKLIFFEQCTAHSLYVYDEIPVEDTWYISSQ